LTCRIFFSLGLGLLAAPAIAAFESAQSALVIVQSDQVLRASRRDRRCQSIHPCPEGVDPFGNAEQRFFHALEMVRMRLPSVEDLAESFIGRLLGLL
jgi:hypothetical protein